MFIWTQLRRLRPYLLILTTVPRAHCKNKKIKKHHHLLNSTLSPNTDEYYNYFNPLLHRASTITMPYAYNVIYYPDNNIIVNEISKRVMV